MMIETVLDAAPQAKENSDPIISTGNSTGAPPPSLPSPLVRNSKAEAYADINVM